MRKARKNIGRLLAVTTFAGLLSGPAVAAADPAPDAWASAGSVDAMIDNEHVVTDELARCDVSGPAQAHTDGGATGTVAVFGGGDTRCVRLDGGQAEADANGRRFEAAVLQRWGGPLLKVRSFTARCVTTPEGSTGEIQVGQVDGVKTPGEIPSNFKVIVPGGPAGTAIANVIFNETITPQPPDGSMVTHAVHIQLYPQGGPASGDIYLGTAHCDPHGKS